MGSRARCEEKITDRCVSLKSTSKLYAPPATIATMILHLILTIIVLICFWLLQTWIASAAFGDAHVKWGMTGIALLVAILIVLQIWGLLGVASLP